MIRNPTTRSLSFLVLALVVGCGDTDVSPEAAVPGAVRCLDSPDTVGYRFLGLQQPTSLRALERELAPGDPEDRRPTTGAMTPIRLLRVASSPPASPSQPPAFEALVRGGLDEPVIGPIVQFNAHDVPALIIGNTLVLTVGARLYLDRAWWDEACTAPYRLTLLEEGVEVIPR
jgi:hypothetical protein